MGARSSGREAALQMLFALDGAGQSGSGSEAVDEVLHHFWREFPADPEGRHYAEVLVRGVRADLAAVDSLLGVACHNWRLERMTRVDRNVLRIGAWELLRQAEVPRAVIIDEAVDIAKRFGTEESSAFVNGVLDRAADECGRPPNTTSSPDVPSSPHSPSSPGAASGD